jgi:hypothetical protein
MFSQHLSNDLNPIGALTMCFNYRMGFDPEPSKNPGDEFLIILTFDPSGMVRVTTLDGRLGVPRYRLEARRSIANRRG